MTAQSISKVPDWGNSVFFIETARLHKKNGENGYINKNVFCCKIGISIDRFCLFCMLDQLNLEYCTKFWVLLHFMRDAD